MGAAGGILGIASACPSFTVQIYESYIKGDVKKAVEMQLKLVHLLDRFAHGLPTYDLIAAVMQAVEVRGIPMGNVRKPGGFATKELEKAVREILSEFDKSAL